MTSILILVAAAGAASRMRGTDKLLRPVRAGVPMLAHVVSTARRTGQPVMVTLRTGDVARRAALDGQHVETVELADAAEGLAASLRAGARAALSRGAAGLLVLPADLPDLVTSDLRAALMAWSRAPDEPLRATAADGTPGHPVILPARLLPQVMGLQGDIGARAILARNPPRLLALEGRRAVDDIDTAEDWKAWQAAVRARKV